MGLIKAVNTQKRIRNRIYVKLAREALGFVQIFLDMSKPGIALAMRSIVATSQDAVSERKEKTTLHSTSRKLI
jgi:hypothetical protein